MGPQLDSCGRSDSADSARPPPKRLQWGRNLTVAEGYMGPPARAGHERFNGAAT